MAEFGADGDLPDIAAKNVTITTTTLPVLSSRTPADNATGVSVAPTLTMVFDRAMNPVDGGTVSIYRSSNDSLVESIPTDPAQARVSGGGTTTLTVELTDDLAELTGYYVQISSAAFRDAGLLNYAGINNATSWNFTTGDFIAPVLTQVTPVPALDNDETPSYTFNTTEAGAITYSGACSSPTASATLGDNTITFSPLIDNEYTDCTIIVTDASNNASSALTVSAFEVDTAAPLLSVQSAVPNPLDRDTATFTFTTTESGTYTLSSCGGSASVSVQGTSVVFSRLTSGQTYTCTLVLN